MSKWKILQELYAGLDARMRPEDVARLILSGFGDELSRHEERLLSDVVQASRARYWGSLMSADFARPVGAHHQVEVLLRLTESWSTTVDAADPRQVRELIARAADPVDWQPGDKFKHRMTRAELKGAGLDLSKRQYNRLLRHLARMHDKVERLDRQTRERELLIVGRNGLVADISFEQFTGDPAAACFVAYYTARRNVRRQFTLDGRTNPFDEVAQMLLRRCVRNGDETNWWMISRVHSKPEIVKQLSPAEQGELMGRWSALMRSAAGILQGAWSDEVDRLTMVVRRGVDSSTWNTVAQAYNTARDGWMNTVYACGAEELLDVLCPGKVMRVMAADLVYWHTSSGSQIDPNTEVWAILPLPWEIIAGKATCTRQTVALACEAAGIDPELSGWTAPRARGAVAKFEPTPELVHGVTVADPVWGELLRRAGAFSGKEIKAGYAGDIAHGLAGGVVTSDLPGKKMAG